MQAHEPSNEQYTVGWVCALSLEATAARAMLDQEFEPLASARTYDSNIYTLGRIKNHNIVIAQLPAGVYGTTSAAITAQEMLYSFPSIRFVLLVGIGGGVPSARYDIRLGDIVVSKPEGAFGGVIQLDLGKVTTTGFTRTGILNKPPAILLKAIASLQSNHDLQGSEDVPRFISGAFQKYPRLRQDASHPGVAMDKLFISDYIHPTATDASCIGCDLSKLAEREDRDSVDPCVHYGNVGSGNQVIKSSYLRDFIGNDCGILCFEMEAAGIMDNFPCIVIRGICDYSDSHKTKEWQRYAAVASTAYAKELLHTVPTAAVQGTHTALSVIQGIQDTLKTVTEEGNHTKIRAKLSPPDLSTNYHGALQTRHENSGAWFLQGESFVRWKSSGRGTSLWLYGLPGSGKTILSSTIIQTLRSGTYAIESRPIVLYFFYDFSDDSKKSFDSMVRSLIYQLYVTNREAREPIELRFADGADLPTLLDLLQSFWNMLSVCKKNVCIVLDALDECEILRNELLGWVAGFDQSRPKNARLLVTSRMEADINLIIGPTGIVGDKVALEPASVNEDIRNYVRDRIQKDPGFRRWRERPDVQQNIESHLMEKSDGMFRWARCQLDTLSKCIDRRQLRKALVSLPKTLYESYSRILRSIPTEQKENATRVLQLLTYTNKSFSIEGILDALAIDLGAEPYFDRADRIPDPDDVIGLCSSLVAVHKQDGLRLLRLSHFSVQQYLKSENVDLGWREALSDQTAMSSIARLCVAYCSSPGLASEVQSLHILNCQTSFDRYAVLNWANRAAAAEEYDTMLCQMVHHFLLREDEAFQSWAQLYSKLRPYYHQHPLHVAASFGLHRSVRMLLEAGVDVNTLDSDPMYEKCTALYAASRAGHDQVVRYLLQEGAIMGLVSGQSELATAIVRNHYNVVQILLDHSADANGYDMIYVNPLRVASSIGSERCVRLLLSHGASFNRGESLSAALDQWHEPVIEALLEHGADVNILARRINIDHVFLTLCAAGNAKLVQLLLTQGAAVNARGAEPLISPIFVSTQFQHTVVMQILLDNDALFDTANESEGATPLMLAASQGSVQCLDLLIQAGSNVNRRDSNGRTPIHHAILGAFERERADTHIELDAQERIGLQSYLSYKRRYGTAMTNLLRQPETKHGSHERHKQPGSRETTPSEDRVILALLEARANVNARDREGWTALHFAASRGRITTARMIINAGANVNAKNIDGRKPLCLARMSQYSDQLVSVLLEAGSQCSCTTCPDQPRSQPGIRRKEAFAQKAWIPNSYLLATSSISPVGSRDEEPRQESADEDRHLEPISLAATGLYSTRQGLGVQETALIGALELELYESAKIFVEANVDLSIRSHYGWLPLHMATLNDQIDLVRAMLSAGSYIDARTSEEGETSLHIAVDEGHLKMASLLLELGANCYARDEYGCLPLHSAAGNGDENLVWLLLDVHSVAQKPTGHGTRSQHHPSRDDTYINGRNINGRTPLHFAAWNGHHKATRILCKKGALVDAKNDWGNTPVQDAADNGYFKTTKLLLRALSRQTIDTARTNMIKRRQSLHEEFENGKWTVRGRHSGDREEVARSSSVPASLRFNHTS